MKTLRAILYVAALAGFYLKYVPLVGGFQIVLVPILAAATGLTWRDLRKGTLFFVFAFLAAISVKFGKDFSTTTSATDFLSSGAILNIVLFIFNMFPVPPLDGYNIFTFLFPRIFRFNQEVMNGLTFLLFMIALFSFKYFYTVGYRLTDIAVLAFFHILNLF